MSASANATASAIAPAPSPRPVRHPSATQDAPNQLHAHLRELALGYQRQLLANPRHPQALLGMSIIALASRQPQSALQLASAAVAAAPHLVLAWVTLGQAARAASLPADAEQAYQQAIRLDGTNPIARTGLGELLLLAGRADEAIPHFELAIRSQPAMAAAHLGLGSALAFLAALSRRFPSMSALSPCVPTYQWRSSQPPLPSPVSAARRRRSAVTAAPSSSVLTSPPPG